MAATVREEGPAATGSVARSFVLVTNAKAGALLGTEDGAASLALLFAAEGAPVTSIDEAAGELPARLAQARDAGADCVVVAGGDGSIACAAQALAGARGPALGIIPCGTMNLLAKDLGLPADAPEQAVRHLVHGRVRRIDVGAIGEHVFTCAAMLGTPALLGRHREAGRAAGQGPRAWFGFARAAARAWWAHRARRLTLDVDGRVTRVRTPSLTIVVNALDDHSGHLFGRSCLDGGEFSIHVVRHRSRLRLLRLLLRAVSAGTLHDRDIDEFRARRLRIDSRARALHVMLDGELRLLPTPLIFELRAGALAVIVPA